jgi:hypothetical protein
MEMRRKLDLLRKFAGNSSIHDFAPEITLPNVPLVVAAAFTAVEGFELVETDTSLGAPAREDFLAEVEFELFPESFFFGCPTSLFMPPQF